MPDFPSPFTMLAVAGVMAALGAAAGGACGGVARAYQRRIDAGAPADASTLAHSVRAALRPSGAASVADTVGMEGPRQRQLFPIPQSSGFSACAAFIMAAAFSILFARHGLGAYFFASALAGTLLLLSALIDARTGLLPDALTQPLLWLGLAVSWMGLGLPPRDALAGVMLGYGLLWCLVLALRWFYGRDAMGHGDLKLLAALGAWLGWQPLLWALLAACLAGLVFAMWRQKSLRPRGAYPFGPFLAMGAAGVFLNATAVHSWFW